MYCVGCAASVIAFDCGCDGSCGETVKSPWMQIVREFHSHCYPAMGDGGISKILYELRTEIIVSAVAHGIGYLYPQNRQ